MGKGTPSCIAVTADIATVAPHNYPLIELVYRGQSRDIALRMTDGRVREHGPAQMRQEAAQAQQAAKKVWDAAQKFIL